MIGKLIILSAPGRESGTESHKLKTSGRDSSAPLIGGETNDVYFMDNYLDLLPGEKRQIKVKFTADTAVSGDLELSGWNVKFNNVKVK